jgi:hypothetical protein
MTGSFLGKGTNTTPVCKQQILNNAKVRLQQWKNRVFCVVRGERLTSGTRSELSSVRKSEESVAVARVFS